MEVAAFSLPKTVGTLPTAVKCHFKYGDTMTLINSGASVAGAKVFSANGLYDPDVTGVGHQPRGFDQMMAMYDHFVVIGAKIKVQFWPRPATTGLTMVGISVQPDNAPYTDVRNYLESANNVSLGISPDGDRCHCLVSEVNPNKFLGRSKPMSDPQLKGSVASNPTEGAFFHVWQDNVTESSTSDILVEIEYVAILIEPKVAPIS